jgi:hypothetical protein
MAAPRSSRRRLVLVLPLAVWLLTACGHASSDDCSSSARREGISQDQLADECSRTAGDETYVFGD